MSSPEAIAERAYPILDRLVGFDTTSRDSNLALIEWVEAYLAGFGLATHRVPNAAGDKANLIATLGPASVGGGIVLSGHTDVVPTEGQPWSSPPSLSGAVQNHQSVRGLSSSIWVAALAAPSRKPPRPASDTSDAIGANATSATAFCLATA